MRYSDDVIDNGNWIELCVDAYAETNWMTFYVIKGYELDKNIYGWGIRDSCGVGYGVWDNLAEAKKVAGALQINKIGEENIGGGVYG